MIVGGYASQKTPQLVINHIRIKYKRRKCRIRTNFVLHKYYQTLYKIHETFTFLNSRNLLKKYNQINKLPKCTNYPRNLYHLPKCYVFFYSKLAYTLIMASRSTEGTSYFYILFLRRNVLQNLRELFVGCRYPTPKKEYLYIVNKIIFLVFLLIFQN